MPHRIAGEGAERLAVNLAALFDGWLAQRRAQAERIIEQHAQDNACPEGADGSGQPPAPGELARALDPPTSEQVAAYYLWSYLWTTTP